MTMRFLLNAEQKRQVNLPHDIDFEKAFIFQHKLRALLSPPFTVLELDKVLELLDGHKDDWLFMGEGFDMAIKKKEIQFKRDELRDQQLGVMKSKAKELRDDIRNTLDKAITQATGRIRAVTAVCAETRRQQQAMNSSDSDVIDVTYSNQPQNQLHLGSGSILPVPHLQNSQPSLHEALEVLTEYGNDISMLYQGIAQSQYELQRLQADIDQLEKLISSRATDSKFKYRFQIGQLVPDNYESIVKCYYCNNNKNCCACPDAGWCQALICHQQVNLSSHVLNDFPDISDMITFAHSQLGVDFDNPMGLLDKLKPVHFPQMAMNPGGITFMSSTQKEIQIVEFQDDGSLKALFANRGNSDLNYPLPLFPSKLLHIDEMWRRRNAEIFFTDSLIFAHGAKLVPAYGDYIFTSYYGAQFGEVNIDLFHFRGRTIHYLIFQHSGLSMDQVIQQACFNLKQMQAIPDLTLDFYFLEPLEYHNSYKVTKVLTTDEFCQEHLKNDTSTVASATAIESIIPQGIEEDDSKEEKPFLLYPLIPEGRYILMAGGKNSGKTLLAASIAASVASGKNIVRVLRPEQKVKKEVVYLDFELGKELFKEHTEKLIESIAGYRREDIPVHVEHMDGIGINIHTEAGIAEVKKKVAPYLDGLKLVIIDNISAVSGSAAGDNPGWNKYTYPYIKSLTEQGISVIVVAHLDNSGKVIGGSQKLLSAPNVICLERRLNKNYEDKANEGGKKNQEDKDKDDSAKTDIVYSNVYMKNALIDFPYFKTVMELTLDKHAERPTWELGNSYLDSIFNATDANDKLAKWFNVTAKTIREWRHKI